MPLYALIVAASAVAMGVVAVAARREVGTWSAGERRVWVALGVVALGLRIAAPWGPHDLNLRNHNLWFDDGSIDVQYGAATVAFVHVVQGLWPGPWAPRVGVDVLAVASAAQAALLALWGARVAGRRDVGLLAGTLLALHPAHVRLGHSDVQTNVEGLWTLGALLLLARQADAPSWGRAVAAGLLAGLAANARPESVVVPALIVLLAAATSGVRGSRAQVAAGCVVMAVVGGVQLVHQAPMYLGVFGGDGFMGGTPEASPQAFASHPLWVNGLAHLIFVDPAWVSPPVAAAYGLVVLAPTVRPSVRALLLLVPLGMVAMVFGDHAWTPHGGLRFGFARHQTRALPLAALASAVGAAGLLDVLEVGPRLRRAGLVGLAVAATLTLPLAFQRRAGQEEFRLQVAAPIPSSCVVVSVRHPMDAGLKPTFPTLGADGAALSFFDAPVRLPDAPCLLYWRSGECSLVPWPLAEITGACDRFEAAHRLTPMEETWIPGGPWVFDDHVSDPIRVGLYRVEAEPRGWRDAEGEPGTVPR